MKRHPRYPTLVVSTSRNPQALALVFEGLRLQTTAPAEILVADDGSDERTENLIRRWTPHLRCTVRHFWQPHEGFRKSIILNRAVGTATGDYLIFLDGDCVPERHFIADHLRYAEPGTFIQGRRAAVRQRYVAQMDPATFMPLWWYVTGRLHGFRHGWRRLRPEIETHDLSFVQGCNLAMWRDDYFLVNGYDEEFSGWGHEDTELAERLRNAGLTCRALVGRAIVYHLDHPPAPRGQMETNAALLARTKTERRAWCDQGVTRGTAARRR